MILQRGGWELLKVTNVFIKCGGTLKTKEGMVRKNNMGKLKIYL